MRNQQRNLLLPAIVIAIIIIGLGAVLGLSKVEPKGTLADNISRREETTQLLSLSSTAGIAADLDDLDNEYTLFAPSNTAFKEEKIKATVEDLEDKIYAPYELLQQISDSEEDSPTDKQIENAQNKAEKASVQLTELLQNHMVEGKFTKAELLEKGSITSIGGLVLEFAENEAGEFTVNGVVVSTVDVPTDNGELFIIDAVLVAQTEE